MIKVNLTTGEKYVEPDKLSAFSEFTKDPIKPELFEKCLQFSAYYSDLDQKSRKLFDNINELFTNKSKQYKPIREWINNFANDISPELTIELINLADKSGNEIFHTIVAIKIADDMVKLDVEGFRKKYKIEGDLSKDAVKQIEKENELWKKIDQ